jgi:DNA mismatch repair protein MutS2
MNSFAQLEYDKYIELLRRECHSEPGRLRIGALRPLTDRKEIERRLIPSGEAQMALRHHWEPALEGVSDLTDLFVEYPHRAYGFEEFRRIHAVLEAANHLLRSSDDENPADFPALFGMVRRILSFPELERRFGQIFGPDGEVLDSASSELRRIRQRKRQVRSAVYETLNRKMNERESLVTDKIVTVRDGRYVIPVREGSAGVFGGIQHGRSQSRSTIFLEPPEAVAHNNELAALEADEQEEIFRIYCDYSDDLRSVGKEILTNTEQLSELDFYFAIGRLSNRMEARPPLIVDEPRLNLIRARHPLLIENLGGVARVIPFDLILGDDYDVLLISGPNTGGKTITLKATGLLAMLALSGLPIPADAASEVGIFEKFFADIGDNQSLENALSTFAAHIRRVGEMLTGNERSLALIDEIGSATDPEQGAALAQAILEGLVERHVKVAATTHYTSLKIYAESAPRCVNAAVQFDPERHTPTYRFAVGLPGNSFAIEAAEINGLDPAIAARARALAGRQNAELTDLIAKVNEEKKELSRQAYDHQLKASLLTRKVEEYEQKIARLDEEAKVQKKAGLREARDLLASLQTEVSMEMERVRKLDKAEKKEGLRQTSQKIADLQRKVAGQEDTISDPGWTPVKTLDPGDKVWVRDFEQVGVVTEVLRDRIRVEVGGFNYTVDASRLYRAPEEKAAPLITAAKAPPPVIVSTELKLLGFTFDEALPLLEEFLDNALRAGLGKVRVVHGKGTGALRNKVRTWLRRNRQVVDFYAPAPEAGGDGVTVVSFRPGEER